MGILKKIFGKDNKKAITNEVESKTWDEGLKDDDEFWASVTPKKKSKSNKKSASKSGSSSTPKKNSPSKPKPAAKPTASAYMSSNTSLADNKKDEAIAKIDKEETQVTVTPAESVESADKVVEEVKNEPGTDAPKVKVDYVAGKTGMEIKIHEKPEAKAKKKAKPEFPKAQKPEVKAEKKAADKAKAEQKTKPEAPKAQKPEANAEKKTADKAKAEQKTKPEAPKAQKPEANAEKKTADKAKAEQKTKPQSPKAQKPEANAEKKAAYTAVAKNNASVKKMNEEVVVEAKTTRSGKFDIKKTKDGRYVFNLYASNHMIIATSQVYASPTNAMVGIRSVIANAPYAPIEDRTLKNAVTVTYPKWEIYEDKGGEYRFRLCASNGSCVCHSQGYTAKSSCKNGIESIIKFAKDADIDKSYLLKKE